MSTRISILILLLFTSLPATAQLTPTSLECDSRTSPIGIESPRPNLSWKLTPSEGNTRNRRQSAWQVKAASSLTRLKVGLADRWDSGRVEDSQSQSCVYRGRSLNSRDMVWWIVRVWDEKGRVGPWSSPQTFSIGLQKSQDWTAKWISAPPVVSKEGAQPLKGLKWWWYGAPNAASSAPPGSIYLRREMVFADQPASGRILISVDNSASVWVNGVAAGGAVAWTPVTSLDISTLLKQGRNVIAIQAINGGPNPNPAGIAGKIILESRDGNNVVIPIDDTWRATDRVSTGWERPGFDDSAWSRPDALIAVGGPPWGQPAAPKVAEPAYWFRKVFQLSGDVRFARLNVCGLGYYEPGINGKPVWDGVLEPAQTDYESRALYRVFDVTRLLHKGQNAIGLWLGDGWFNQNRVWGGMSYGRPCAIAHLEVVLKGGQTVTINTDGTWTCARSPITSSNIYAGETFDSRQWNPDWSAPNSGPNSDSTALVVAAPTQHLGSASLPPCRRIRSIPVRSVRRFPDGSSVWDFGENIAGWVRLKAVVPNGQRITMTFAEAVKPDGNIDTASTGVFATGVEQVDTFIGSGSFADWEPRFTYHGFRYVAVTGLPRNAGKNALTAIEVHSDVARTGTFSCSDPMLNRIYAAAIRTQLGNLHGVSTDCPARERCGWLGDASISVDWTWNLSDMRTFWPKYLDDIRTSWRGERPGDVAPGKRASDPNGHTDWGLALINIPWKSYQFTGDRVELAKRFPDMVRFMRAVRKTAKNGLLGYGYGDWCAPGGVEPTEVTPTFTTTILTSEGCRITASVARILAQESVAKEFDSDRATYRDAVIAKFYDKAKHSFGSQTANVLALTFHLVPETDRSALALALRNEILIRHNGHHSTGIFGSRYLYDVLASTGQGDLAMRMLHNSDYPSIGHLFSLGATTLWECWGEPELDQKWGARSLNHPMQAAFAAWFMEGVAGIRSREDGPGFSTFDLTPQPLPGLSWAKGRLETVRGPISSLWQVKGGKFEWDFEVPVGSRARVELPVGWKVQNGLRFSASFVGSGRYHIAGSVVQSINKQ